MSKTPILEKIKSGIFFLDGATGSNLQKAGMPVGVCPEKWILEHKEVMGKLQRSYYEAGSHLVLAPTFTANRIKLAEYGLEDQIVSINRELVAISKSVASEEDYVAADISMTGVSLAPVGNYDFEDLIQVYREQVKILAECGVDVFLVETMMSLQECRAAVIAIKEVTDIPVMVTLTFEADGRTLYGTDAKTAAIVLSKMGVAAVGVNCSVGPDRMVSVVKDMASVTDIPIIAKPNAGLPALDAKGNTVYDMDADTFSKNMTMLVDAGASILGGCCGTTPEYIEKTAKILKDYSPKTHIRKTGGRRYLTSERQTLEFSLEDPVHIIGERINPTGKKAFQESIRSNDFEIVRSFAEEQEAHGASILDVNMGMNGIDEEACMLQALDEVSMVSNLPLSLDTSHVSVMEQALRKYPGRALVNSVSLEPGKAEALLPLVKKYGAMFILLPLSEKGLPKDLNEKIEIIHKIEQMAYDAGLSKEDIIVDCLVATVGANPNAALETLECIRYCKEHGFATMGGLSNISFGLPERSFVNAAFMTMAIQAGITMAIANPNQDLLLSCALASDLLMNKPHADLRYIEGMARRTEFLEIEKQKEAQKQSVTPAVPVQTGTLKNETTQADDPAAELSPACRACYDFVIKGNRANAVKITESAIAQEISPETILNDCLLPAINKVGDYFDQGKYFLPQLIASAEAMKLSIEYLEPLLQKNQGDTSQNPVIVIATVKGDIHDIGKNLVALMLKNYGFRVIDLGKDVPRELIVETAMKENAEIIALSALMTTTMTEMKQVIAYAKQQGCKAKVMIGGAVITQSYADEIGAEGYSKDASEAVRVAKLLCGASQE